MKKMDLQVLDGNRHELETAALKAAATGSTRKLGQYVEKLKPRGRLYGVSREEPQDGITAPSRSPESY